MRRREFLGSAALSLSCAALGAAPAPRRAVAVVRPVNACAAGDRNYAASIARHAVRWLEGGGVKADLVDDASPQTAFSGRRLIVLVMCSNPGRAELDALSRHLAQGGRILSFYSQSPALASLMGVRLGAYKRPVAGTYSSMSVSGQGVPAGAPCTIVQSSANIFSALPVAGRSRVIATWCNRAGLATGDAAILASAAGWWVTHVFLADGDENAKQQFLLSAVGASAPGLWNASAWAAKRNADAAAMRALGAAQKPRPGEIHAVWDHSGQGLYPGNWPRTMKLLRDHRMTDLFVNVCGAGFAHYPSTVLPPSNVLQTQGDQLAACLAAARGTGVRVHAWMICFNATRATPARLATFSKNGWRMRNTSGSELEYLDPSSPTLRTYLLGAVEELARKYPVDGVHLDFIRWYESVPAAESTPGALARYRAETPTRSRRTFCDWRARQIGTFVALARGKVKRARPAAWFTTAVLGKYPSCVDSVGQDWESWIDGGLVDFVVPMNYTEDPAKYAAFVAQQGRTRAHARRVISGLGVTANESRLDARQVIAQVNAARRAGLAGVALFDLDFQLATSILPILRLGMF